MIFKRQLEEAGITLEKEKDGSYNVYYKDTYVGYLWREYNKGTGKWGNKTPAYYSWEFARNSEPELYLTTNTLRVYQTAQDRLGTAAGQPLPIAPAPPSHRAGCGGTQYRAFHDGSGKISEP